MYGNEKDNLQLLGAALIVLSLALLYCWYKKQNKTRGRGHSWYEGMGNSYADNVPSKFEGLRSKNVPGLSFAEPKSMHDLEGLAVNRNPPSDQELRSNVTGLRWAVDGMDTVDTSAMFESDTYEKARFASYMNKSGNHASGIDLERFYEDIDNNRPISGDVVTPFKPLQGSSCKSHSGDQLTMTEAGVNYGSTATTWGASRPGSGVSI